jgi:NAD+ kinase
MDRPANIGIIANLGKPEAVPRLREMLRLLAEQGLAVVLETDTAAAIQRRDGHSLSRLAAQSDVIIVLGGDGTILHTARQLGSHVKPLAGLNIGRLGFMTTATDTQAAEMVRCLAEGRCGLSSRSVLEVEICVPGSEKTTLKYGLNEMTLTRGSISRTIHVEMLVDGAMLNRYSGDGVIIATPTGSTAYSLSAGGPLITPDAGVFVVTPICQHTLTSRSIILPDAVEFTLRAADNREDILLTVDGGIPKKLSCATTVKVRKAAYRVPLVTMPGASFFGLLHEKLRWVGSNLPEH